MSSSKRQSKQRKMRTIGRWYIGETLGKGGYSWVKKGFDKKTGKCVALKFLAKADESWAKEQSKQVVTEIESLKQIRHPNVMKLYAYNLNARYPTKKGHKIDTVLLVLEFAPGGEIFDILYYTSKLEPILARTYFRQSIIGLEACHNAGVAHRDIKPQNLLLDSRFNIKLTDFGLSKVFESDADDIMKTTYVGTRGYQAPELLLDQPYDLSCDVFSMGVVLFILITGYPPFEQAHYSDRWFRPLAKGDYAKFWKYHEGCSISNDLACRDLLEDMMCANPKNRITIAQIKKHDWFNGKYLEGKDLIRTLRHRHCEMEAKRRKDARKIADLQVSMTPNTRGLADPVVADWKEEWGPEQMLSRCHCHFVDGKEFFGLLSGLIGNSYSGATEYDASTATMTCTVTKMEKSRSSASAKSLKRDYKLLVQLFRSREYALDTPSSTVDPEDDESKDVDPDQLAAAMDDEAHSAATNKETVFVVVIKRLLGDDFKFRELHRKLLVDGAQIFNGLPEWAQKSKASDNAFDQILAKWDDAKVDDDDDGDEEYDDVEYDEEVDELQNETAHIDLNETAVNEPMVNQPMVNEQMVNHEALKAVPLIEAQ